MIKQEMIHPPVLMLGVFILLIEIDMATFNKIKILKNEQKDKKVKRIETNI